MWSPVSGLEVALWNVSCTRQHLLLPGSIAVLQLKLMCPRGLICHETDKISGKEVHKVMLARPLFYGKHRNSPALASASGQGPASEKELRRGNCICFARFLINLGWSQSAGAGCKYCSKLGRKIPVSFRSFTGLAGVVLWN